MALDGFKVAAFERIDDLIAHREAMPKLADVCRSLGAARILAKPFIAQDLLRTVHELATQATL